MTRWITDTLGTCSYGQRPDGDVYLLDVRHLVDKGGNSSAIITECIEAGTAALKAGRTIVVTCDFGISRSNSIAAGILSVTDKCTLDDAISRVVLATGETEIKLDMIESIRNALSPIHAPTATGTVLVTGGSGFLGRCLVPRLQISNRVVAPSHHILNIDDGAVKLAGYCRSEGVSQIVHLAYPHLYTNVGAMASSLAMLRTVLETCKLLNIRLLFISGWVVFADYATSQLIADETLPFRPKGVYSDSKYLEELLVQAYIKRGEVSCSICRFSPVYGPGGERPRLIKTFYEAIVAGRQIHTHRYLNGQPKLDLLYIDDAVDAIARVAAHSSNDVFHFGSDRLHSTAELAELIAELTNCSLHREEVAIEDHIANIQMNISKAASVLEWHPVTMLREGLSKCLGLESTIPTLMLP